MPKKIIYAEDAIDALADYIHNVNKVMGNGKLSAWDCADAAWSVLGDLPSAQPECKRECMPMYADVSDCISRQAAIDEAYEIIIDGQKFEVVQVETLMGLPSAQLQRIRAKWIYGDGYCKCSACGEDPIEFVETTGFDAALMNEENPMKFCPNCGADMRGKQDE